MATRTLTHARLADVLARASDVELASRVQGGHRLSVGVGGTTVQIDVERVPVFVKRLPLTDLERLPENVRSTANLFGLPPSCHYGLASIGTPGFGAWRELAANITTTGWVLSGGCLSFPLLHHWRVLPGTPSHCDELADVEAAVAFWGNASQVGKRIEAVASASAELLLFLEFVPVTLADWLEDVLARPDEEAAAACAMVERELRTTLPFAATNGLIHFDSHFRNILTDGERLYLADLGLAASIDFALDDDERAFVQDHDTYDKANTLALLVNSVVVALTAAENWPQRFELIRRWADGEVPSGVPAAVADVVGRYVPLAVVMNDVALRIMEDPTTAPYPVEAVAAAHRAATKQ